MRVYGEAFWAINGWMNFLSLLLASRLGGAAFRPLRALAAAALGAAYGVFAWMSGPAWRGLPAVLAAGLGMAVMAFGSRALRLGLTEMAAGLLLSGWAAYLTHLGLGTAEILLLSGGLAAGCGALAGRNRTAPSGSFTLRLRLNGQEALLPALRDTGNLLRDGITGLPVIVASRRGLKKLLPAGVNPGDLATLPKGWYLVRARTAAGSRTLMCFRPDAAQLLRDGREWRVEAAVAVSDFSESRALLPEALFDQEEETDHAGF